MTLYRTVLGFVRRGTPLREIAAELEMQEDAVRAMMESMVREGHARKMGCQGDTCSACPMAESCSFTQDSPDSYFVTEAGREFLDEEDTADSPPLVDGL